MPEARRRIEMSASDKKLLVRCLLTEYSQGAEAYRHTYATIWQACAIFSALTIGLLGFSIYTGRFTDYAPLGAALSYGIWWLFIFETMNSYGDQRERRCAEIERQLKKIVPDLTMALFSRYTKSREGRFLRVRWGVRLFGALFIFMLVMLAIDKLPP